DVDEATLPPDVYLSPGIAEPHGPIVLGPAEDYLSADFGYYPGGSIGDLVWWDLDADGLRDPNEMGIPGVRVRLLDPGANGLCEPSDAVIDTAITRILYPNKGKYLFDPLPAGLYCVDVVEATLPPDAFLTPGMAEPHGPIALDPWEDYLDADFGYYPGGSIGDLVWLD
ncbi:MAG: SdrD B-like domain-containing protein, partial [Anaerolineae bacterium]|nr:SdrD B-like domain-containing protein [Anaerolineae bacterium]